MYDVILYVQNFREIDLKLLMDRCYYYSLSLPVIFLIVVFAPSSYPVKEMFKEW